MLEVYAVHFGVSLLSHIILDSKCVYMTLYYLPIGISYSVHISFQPNCARFDSSPGTHVCVHYVHTSKGGVSGSRNAIDGSQEASES